MFGNNDIDQMTRLSTTHNWEKNMINNFSIYLV